MTLTAPATASDTSQRALVPLDPRARALARLAMSRQRLRASMLAPVDEAASPPSPSTPASSRWRLWRRWARQSPVVLAGLTAVTSWWRAQPWQPAVDAGARELGATVTPLVRRHPVLGLLAAAGAGAGLVLARRWWWPLASVHARPLPGRIAQWAWAQAAQPATQALLAQWWLSRRPESARPAGAPEQTFTAPGP